MGRGGKKKGKKEVEDVGLGSLSLSDAPSTSTLPTQEATTEQPDKKEEEEEGFGLSLGGGGKKSGARKKTKAKQAQATQQIPSGGPPQDPQQTSHVSQQPSPWGRGIQQAPSAPQVAPAPFVGSTSEPMQTPQQTGQQQGWGRGQPGQGRGQPGQGRGQPGQGRGQPGQGRGQPGQGRGQGGRGSGDYGPQRPGWTTQQPIQPEHIPQQQQYPPQQQQYPPQQQQYPPQQQQYPPQQQQYPPQQQQYPPQQQQYPPQQQQYPPQQQQYPPQQQQYPPQQQQHPPQQSQPQQPQASQQYSQPQPQQQQKKPQHSQQQEPPKSSPSKTVACRFQIPKKIRSKVPIQAADTKVLTNYLPMTIKALNVYRYDVAIKPDRPKKFMPKVFKAMKDIYYKKLIIAFDQVKNCYSLKPLLKGDERFCTEVEFQDDNGKTCKYEIALKLTGMVDLGTILSYMRDGTALMPPTEAIQCIDVVLRQGALENYVKAGRQYFMRPRNPIDLGDGLEMWTGLFQSAIFTCRPFINIDVAHKGFPKSQPLVDTYMRDFRLDPKSPIEKQRKMECELFCKFIRGLRVVATIGDAATGYRKREFICNDIKPPANALKFTITDSGQNKTVTVEQYFTSKGYRLQYPNLNCIWVGPRDKEIYYPMELLHIAYGQALNRQLNERQLSKMVREAATPPSDRKRKIEEVIKDMRYSSNEYFREFGLEISNNFYEVGAKVLNPPILNVGEGTVRPRNGVWMAKRLLKPSALQSWGFLVVETDPNRIQCNDIIQKIQCIGRQMGMEVQPPLLTNFNVRAQELHSVFKKAADMRVTFLFVIVSTWSKNLYQRVKKMAELEVGILTQCIKDQTAERRMNEQTIRNILLKVNSKLMGVNQTLGNMSEPPCLKNGGVMVVGADVTHPSPDQTDIPSIAAVTASFDTKCFQYNIELSIQTPKREMIVEFEGMMVEHLKVYKKHQNSLPRKIFIFRDGVSEGQFAQVMNSELVAVYQAYARLAGPNVKPEVLFMLVQKRHHTRFFLGAQNSQNVQPGTVVDKDIVHNSEMDFYLVSHQAIKGTARPTRYYGVRNDGNISIEEVEQLTYYLCHLYSRCTRAVSYPTPTYYAHLACTRAKNLTFGDRFNNRELELRPQRLQVLNRMLDYSRMFFV